MSSAQINPYSKYPRFVYKATLAPKIVDNEDQHKAALSSGWKDSYQFQEYPKMVYKDGQLPKVVKDADELKKLGSGWGALPVGKKAEVVNQNGREWVKIVDDPEYEAPEAPAKGKNK